MNISRMNKPELIIELEKRSLPTNGLKDELKSRLLEAIEKENLEADIGDEDSSENEEVSDNVNIDDLKDNIIDNDLKETCKEDDIIFGADQSTILTVEDAIRMKTSQEIESDSVIVNINEDVDNESISNSPSDNIVSSVPTNNNREMDNGDHEIIEINEEVVIDDDDNQENDNNYNDISSDSNQMHSREVENEVEKFESRPDDASKILAKTEIWVSNIAEDVKAVELKELFGKFGKVVSAKVVMNAKNPSGSCFGCIQLATPSDAKLCITNLDQTEFRGNIISITNEITDKVSKEKVIRNISPVSSSASWGSKKKSNIRDTSCSPAANSSPLQSTNKSRTDTYEKGRRPSYRDKQNFTGGGFYKGKDFPDRGSTSRRGNRGTQYNDRRNNYSDRSNTKSYKSNSYTDTFNSNSHSTNNNSRQREMFQKRDSRDNYNSQYDSRYRGSSRERQSLRSEYSDKTKPQPPSSYDYRSRSNSNRYESYGNDYDRRERRSGYDSRPSRGIDSVSGGGFHHTHQDRHDSSGKRELYKRMRPDDVDDYLHGKKRRSDLISSDRSSHYYRSGESPKKSYYQEKDFRKPEYNPRRDDYKSSSDYNFKNERDFFPSKRSQDYSDRREVSGYNMYSPDRHTSRSNHYSKESYIQHSTDFGGRSKRY